MDTPMRIVSGLSLSIGLLAMTLAAEAAAPKVAGKYAVMGYDLCQARFFTNFDNFSRPSKPAAPAVVSVQPEVNGFGTLRVRVGVITFPATASTSGNASVSFVIVQGATAKINHLGTNMARSTSSLNGAFSFTASTFTFGGSVHDIQVANVVSGVARTIYAVAQPSGGAPNCATAIMMTKQ